jgi:hypothetical protein
MKIIFDFLQSESKLRFKNDERSKADLNATIVGVGVFGLGVEELHATLLKNKLVAE